MSLGRNSSELFVNLVPYVQNKKKKTSEYLDMSTRPLGMRVMSRKREQCSVSRITHVKILVD